MFAYNGNQVDVSGGWSFPLGIVAELSYAYRHEDYSWQSNPGGDPRMDNENEVLFTLTKQLTEYVAVSAGYLGDFNDSNEAVFTYTRNVGSVTLDVRFH